MKQSKIGFLAAICIAIVVLIPATVFAAQKSKRTDAETKQLFEKWDSGIHNSYEVSNALNVMVQSINKHGTSKGVGALLAATLDKTTKTLHFATKIIDLKKGFDLFMEWRRTKDSKNITKGTKLMFDMIDYASGYWVGGSYVSAIAKCANTAFDVVNETVGGKEFDFLEIKYASGKFNSVFENQWGICFTSENRAFSKAWYSANYKNKLNPHAEWDVSTLDEIAAYLKAIETLKKAGLIK